MTTGRTPANTWHATITQYSDGDNPLAANLNAASEDLGDNCVYLRGRLDAILPDASTADFTGRAVSCDSLQCTGAMLLGNGTGDLLDQRGTLTPNQGGLYVPKMVEQDLSGDLTPTRYEWDVLVVTSCLGSNRNIAFSATSMQLGVQKTVRHGGSANTITLRNPGPVDICTLNPGEYATLIWSPTNYFWRIGG